jgi:class 3 adenylate cyclase/tetratricopeptide (TPR) repeat protein
MPACAACGHFNPANARFCMSCGAPLAVDAPGPIATRKIVTIVFCDVAGSTAIGERLDPESVREVMTGFYGAMRGALERHGGTVEKFIGDAVMGVFGVPILHEDDALRAVEAADAMRAAVGELNRTLAERFDVELATRIGVNTGEVIVGDPDAGEALVVGDAVNVAARLEQVAGAGEVLLGPQTHALVRQHVVAAPVGPLELKGKSGGVPTYRLERVAPADDAIGLRVDPPFVGRDAELGALREAFERARSRSTCVLATVIGSAGVGKSRLAREFVAELAGDARVVSGRCLPYGDGITFWPVIELVKDACGISDGEPRAAARTKIDEVLAGAEDAALVAERVAAVVGLGETSAGLQETFWSIRRLLEWLARDRPLVALVDDVHWAEPTFLDLVEYLAGWTQQSPIVVLALARPDLLDVRPGWGSQPDGVAVQLGPLDEGESDRLIGSVLGAGLDDPVLERIREAGGGNPLFLEEMLRMLEDDGVLERTNGRWHPTRRPAELPVPGSIQALLGARLDRLSGEERSVIRAAAVVGKEFWWGAVDSLVDAEVRPRVGAHLQTLVRKDLIRPERSTLVGEDAFGFHHLLIQEAAYLGAPKDVRATMHERFAAWIEATAGDRLAELEPLLGHHLERAYRFRAELETPGTRERELAERAAEWLIRAGLRAAERRDAAAESDLLGRALALLAPDASARASVLLDLVDARSEVGDLDGAESALAELETASRDDPALVARTQILRLTLLESTDPKALVDAVADTERHLRTLEAAGDDLWMARGWLLIGDLHWARSRYGEADLALERAIEHARRAGARREEGDALGRYTGAGVFGPAPVEEAERRALDVLDRLAGTASEGPALRALASVRAMQGRFDEARATGARARTIMEELGLRLRANWTRETTGYIELLAGDPVAAEREFRTGRDAAAQFGDHGFEGTAAALLAHALLEQGRAAEGEEAARQAEAIAADDDQSTQVLWRSARARAIARRDPKAAAELAREAVELAMATDDVDMQADALADFGEVLGALGDRDGARQAFDDAFARVERKGNAASRERIRTRAAFVTE